MKMYFVENAKPTNIQKFIRLLTNFRKNLKTSKNELFCEICNVIVKHERRSRVTKHRDSSKHSI